MGVDIFLAAIKLLQKINYLIPVLIQFKTSLITSDFKNVYRFVLFIGFETGQIFESKSIANFDC